MAPPVSNFRPRHKAARILARTHLVQAALLLTQPLDVLRLMVGGRDVPPLWIVRLLGVRTLAQSAAEVTRPRRDVLVIGVGLDVAHAASMLAAAKVWPRYRRAALISAASATASAVVGAVLTGSLK